MELIYDPWNGAGSSEVGIVSTCSRQVETGVWIVSCYPARGPWKDITTGGITSKKNSTSIFYDSDQAVLLYAIAPTLVQMLSTVIILSTRVGSQHKKRFEVIHQSRDELRVLSQDSLKGVELPVE